MEGVVDVQTVMGNYPKSDHSPYLKKNSVFKKKHIKKYFSFGNI